MCPPGSLFFAGILPGVVLGLTMMGVVSILSAKRLYPRSPKTAIRDTAASFFGSFPALIIGMAVYRTITFRDIPSIIKKTLKLSSLSLFALFTASALGELLGYYNVSTRAAGFFRAFPGGVNLFMLVVIAFFLFVGTFMDAVPAMILFVPVILPTAAQLSVNPAHWVSWW